MNTPIKLNRWIVWPAVAVLVAVVLVACGGGEREPVTAEVRSSPLAAGLGQAVTWTPASITDSIAPGTQQTIPVSFTASSNLQNVAVNVVPALQGLVQVNPSSFASVQKGQAVTVTLAISAATSAPLALTQGTIQLRIKSATVAQPLPVQIIVASGAIGLLPPDPGSAGMATLAGIDSNNDGVRDDIERYIWFTYPQSQKIRSGLMDFSRSKQDALLSGNVKTDALLAAAGLRKAIDCLWYMYAGPASFDVWEKLAAQYLNTEARSRADKTYQRLLSGEFFASTPESQRKASCSFDPDALPN